MSKSRAFLHRSLQTTLAAAVAVGIVLPAAAGAAQKRRSDAAPPETTITGGPSGPISVRDVSFGFTSSERQSSFQCSLNGSAFASCSSPKSYSGIPDGSYDFSVRAIDRSADIDPTPATRSFAVSSTAPPSDPPSSGSGAIPASWPRFSSFETTLDENSDYGWRVDSPFQVTRTSEVGGPTGSYAAKIVTNGGNSSCSCPRMTFDNVGPLSSGDEVWMGGSWYVTDASKLAWSRLMNLGHFESSGDPDNWYLALFSRDPGQMEVVARNYNTDSGQSILMAARPIPQERWFSVDVHAILSPVDGQALTDVYLDGELVAHSTKRNMWNSGTLTFYNGGLPYFWDRNGNTTVYFDSPRLRY